MRENQKNELTIQSIVELLEKENIKLEDLNFCNTKQRNFTLVIYNRIIKNLLDYFFDYKIVELNKGNIKYHTSGCLLFNEKHKEKWIDDLYAIEYETLYPNVLCKLYDNKKIIFNIDEFIDIYKFLIINYKNLKKIRPKEEVRALWKVIINFTFGALQHKDSYIQYKQEIEEINKNGFMLNLISSYTHKIFNKVFYKYNDYIIAIETDVIYYLPDIPKSFFDDINKLDLKYDIINCEGIFSRKKHHFVNKKII